MKAIVEVVSWIEIVRFIMQVFMNEIQEVLETGHTRENSGWWHLSVKRWRHNMNF